MSPYSFRIKKAI